MLLELVGRGNTAVKAASVINPAVMLAQLAAPSRVMSTNAGKRDPRLVAEIALGVEPPVFC